MDRHVGDLGNIISHDYYYGNETWVDIVDKIISLEKGHIANILHRTIVIHEKEDDFKGLSGHAGSRIACGIIKIPL